MGRVLYASAVSPLAHISHRDHSTTSLNGNFPPSLHSVVFCESQNCAPMGQWIPRNTMCVKMRGGEVLHGEGESAKIYFPIFHKWKYLA